MKTTAMAAIPQVFTNEEFGEIHARLLPNNEIEINLEDAARGLGFVRTAASGNVVVRWERVNGYLAEFGFEGTIDQTTYIPEHIFYRLAMKANNERAERFQDWVAREAIPSIRKRGYYAQQNTPVVYNVKADPFLRDLVLKLKEGAEYSRVYPRMMWVYAFKMDNGTVKIGVSSDVAQRTRNIEGSSGHEVLEEYHTFLAPERLAYSIERRCHETFKDYRLKKGEYFRIAFEEACCELDKYNPEIIRAVVELMGLQKEYNAKLEAGIKINVPDMIMQQLLDDPDVIIEVATNLKTRYEQIIEFAESLKRQRQKIECQRQKIAWLEAINAELKNQIAEQQKSVEGQK